MSFTTRQEAIENGLANNPFVATCLPAALDSLYEQIGIPLWFYSFYNDLFAEQERDGKNVKRTKLVYEQLLCQITGSTRLKQIRYKRGRSPEETSSIIKKANAGGFKIIIVVRELHVVGLKPKANNLWQMVGDWLPTSNEITSEGVYRYLYQNKPLKRNINDSNIFLFPPMK